MTNKKTHSVLLVDDHKMFRQALISLLDTRPDLVTVCGEAENGCRAISLARQLEPDIILLDIGLPDCNGLELIPALRANSPQSAIVILSASGDPETIYQAIGAGVDGYITKAVDISIFFYLLDSINKGQIAISHRVATLLAHQVAKRACQEQQVEQQRFVNMFDDIDNLIIEYVARGKTNTEIADALCVSTHTVKVRLTSIFKKLNLENRTQLAVFYSSHMSSTPSIIS